MKKINNKKNVKETSIKLSESDFMRLEDEKYIMLIIRELLLGKAENNNYYSFIEEHLEIYGILRRKHFLFLFQRLITNEIIENYSIKNKDVVETLVNIREDLYKLKRKYIDFYDEESSAP